MRNNSIWPRGPSESPGWRDAGKQRLKPQRGLDGHATTEPCASRWTRRSARESDVPLESVDSGFLSQLWIASALILLSSCNNSYLQLPLLDGVGWGVAAGIGCWVWGGLGDAEEYGKRLGPGVVPVSMINGIRSLAPTTITFVFGDLASSRVASMPLYLKRLLTSLPSVDWSDSRTTWLYLWIPSASISFLSFSCVSLEILNFISSESCCWTSLA